MTWYHRVVVVSCAFAVGACLGSFLNVCLYRIPRWQSLLWPPSRCPRCASAIAPCDNLPIVGWLLLRGRCRHCGQPISIRYPLVEALVGALLAGLSLPFVARLDDEAGPTAEASARRAEAGVQGHIQGRVEFRGDGKIPPG